MTEIIANYDETWKYVISGYFESFLLFFYPDIHSQINWKKNPVPLEKELAKITADAKTEKRHADKLFKVWLLTGQEVWILIHIEVQSQYDKNFPLRMFIYNYRAFDLHKRPVISLAILGDNNQSWRPNCYQYGMGNSQVNMKFNIVKLLDYQWEVLEQSNNVFAIVVMAHLKTKATHGNLTTREQWKWQLTRLLYEKGYNRKEIVDLYKVIDLMMALSEDLQMGFEQKLTNYQEERKMPLLTNIERRALDKGAKENSRQNILDLLENRFGTLPNSLMTSLNKIDDLSRLKQLHLATIQVNSVAEFEQLINQNSPN
ncbi:MAG TPA: hypothetical protein V6C58_10020 [Allocoleopsis sp.]